MIEEVFKPKWHVSTISLLNRALPADRKPSKGQTANLFYDSPRPKQAISLTNVSWLLDTRKDAMKKVSPFICLFAKDNQTMTSGWQGAPYFRSYGRMLVSKPAISLKKS